MSERESAKKLSFGEGILKHQECQSSHITKVFLYHIIGISLVTVTAAMVSPKFLSPVESPSSDNNLRLFLM